MDVQRYTIEEKKTNKLPEASFRIIEDYYKSLPDAPPQPSNYHRFVVNGSGDQGNVSGVSVCSCYCAEWLSPLHFGCRGMYGLGTQAGIWLQPGSLETM